MSQDPADDAASVRPSMRTAPAKKRRALRVPIDRVSYTSAVEELNGSAADPVEYEVPSGVTSTEGVAEASPFGLHEAPTEPMDSPFEQEQTDPEPPATRHSEPPSVEVDMEAATPAERASEPLPIEVDIRSSAPPERSSEPPEELSLDDAEEVEGEYFFDRGAVRIQGNVIHMPPPPPPTTRRTQTKKPAPPVVDKTRWYEDFFGENYLRTVRTPTPRQVARECDFIEQALAVAPGSRIADIGCGLGLHAIELTSRGYQVVGLDISPTMITRARAEAGDRGLQVQFVEGDMRTMAFDAPFDAVLCWGTSFGYFDEEDNVETIKRLFDALKPGGVLLLDVANRDYLIGRQPNQVWFEVDGSICMEETDFDYQTSRLVVRRNVVSEQGDERDREYSIRLYALHELSRLLGANGFEVDQVSGRQAALGVFFGEASPQLIVRAQRGTALFSTPPSDPATKEPDWDDDETLLYDKDE